MKAFVLIQAFAAALAAQTPSVPTTPAAPATPAPQVKPDEIVLKVGDRAFTQAQYEELVRSVVPPASQPFALGTGKREFAKRIVELIVLTSEAEKLHLDQRPETALQLELQRNTRLAAAEFQTLLKIIPVTDAQIQAFYDANKSLYEVLHVRHIMVRVKGSQAPAKPGKPELTDDEAEKKAAALRKRILDGEDFAKVAREESDDPSGSKGGDIGEIRHGVALPQIEQSAFALKTGDLSDPVRTQFGYHIIQVQSRSTQPFTEVKDDVAARVRQGMAPQVAQAMIDKAGFHIDEKYFGPDPSAPQPAPAQPTPPASR